MNNDVCLPVDVGVSDLHLEDEVHELHERLVLLQLITLIHPDLVATTGNQVLITVENSLSFKTHL
jgi:hypothetical protein